jgi:uncharacterized membrane protein YcaP (DUF421 family)
MHGSVKQGQRRADNNKAEVPDLADIIIPFDLSRMLFGTAPPLFYLEILVRTAVVYTYSLVLIRWVGGRGIAQMSVVEFLLVIALGSAVGDSLFYPEVPLLHALATITNVVVINKALDVLIFQSRRAERFITGVTCEIVRDGVIDHEVIAARKLGQSELFEAMRQQQISNLGQLARAYLETSGHISFVLADSVRPGLSVVPPWSIESPRTVVPQDALPQRCNLACCTCGTVLLDLSSVPKKCPSCGARAWTFAQTPKAAKCSS